VGAMLDRWAVAAVRHRWRGRSWLVDPQHTRREEIADGPAVRVGSGQITVGWSGTVELGWAQCRTKISLFPIFQLVQA
jgi:hypothetical protein